MNAMTTVAHAAPAALTPSNFGEAMRLAEMMSQGKLVPAHLQGKPADCLMVIEQAVRWNTSPFAVAQSTSVISGKLMFEGKLVAAVVNASGLLVGRLRHDLSGEGDSRKVTVSGHIAGEAEPRTVEVTLKEAKTTNGMWTKQPDQQLVYAGSRVWARRHTPEVMLGIYSPEEMTPEQQAPRHVESTQVPPARRPPLDDGLVAHVAQMQADKLPIVTPAGEQITVAKNRWLAAVTRAAAAMESIEAVRAWRAEMGPFLASISETEAALVEQAEAIITQRVESFAEDAKGDAWEPTDAA
jgi:hypothetical protein